jgi:hypothetical protein
LAEFWYNSNYHTALGCSPFKALYGYDPEMGVMLPTLATSSASAEQLLKDKDAQLVKLKEHLCAA